MKIYEATLKYNEVASIESESLNNAGCVVKYMAGAFDQYKMQEQVWIIALNRKNKALGRSMVSLGSIGSSIVNPMEIFRFLILSNAPAFIMVHNHPSGDPHKSRCDIEVTRKIKEASKVMCIEFLDHIIIGEKDEDPLGVGYYSFQEKGLV